MGLLPAFISCLFAASCSAFGLYLLSLCARQVGRPTTQPPSAFSSRGNNNETVHEDGAKPDGTEDDDFTHGTTVDGQSARVQEPEEEPVSTIAAGKSRLERPEASFNQIALLTFGGGWATRCFDAAIAIKCFGVSVSYLIIVKVSLVHPISLICRL